MRVILEEKSKLTTLKLTIDTVGNYWLKDSNKNNLVNIEAIDGKWIAKSNINYKILKDVNYKENETLTNVNQLDSIELIPFASFYILDTSTNNTLKIYVTPTYDSTMIQLIVDFANIKEFIIGNDKNNVINCSNPIFTKNQLEIKFENNQLKIKNNNTKLPMYINDILEEEKILLSGDMVFIDGLMFTFINNILLINNPNNIIFYDSLKLAKRSLPNNPEKDYSSESETFIEAFSKSDYFQRPPRFKRIIEHKEYNIDPPTKADNDVEMPLIYTIGPMILMGLASVASSLGAITNVLSGKSSFKENMAPIMMTLAMVGSMILFPLLQKLYTKRTKFFKERKRRKKYKKYIEEEKEEILAEIELQRQILIENNMDLMSVANIIMQKGRTLWDRKLEHPDFLNIRLGIGVAKPQITINYPEKHFTMDEDDLRDVYEDLFKSIKDIENVPVVTNLINKRLTGIVGEYRYIKQFIDGIMLQLLAYHSYDMLKIAIITSNEKKSTWLKYRNIPHFWNNEKTVRYIGIDNDNINKVSNALIQKYNERLSSVEDNENSNIDEENEYKNYKEYYLIISDEVDTLKNTSIFNELIKQKVNFGFSMLMIAEKLDELPNECMNFVNVSPNGSALFENELMSTNQTSFVPDIPNFNMNKCYLNLCNIPVNIDAGKFALPKTYSFLEMYNVGNVKQLNISNRWKNNNPIQSLAVPVGINEQGEIFKIDLHEKYHGPHGLVAGMTGSGKSEWIISYILSMAINFHPDEVQFVLIDYKGGGLAGTFENKETGVRLPHLAGTITNLDISEINRSLASINSELKRRQALFNAARDSLGESSVDIYKYQKWYREGKITTPISHLFIISDEFAELKSQQPEFMDELISTARIGRSLGVHLILATQKPNGVVDDQIWSNSKFRVCLKVQDKSDSNDMIRVPDAAYLKEAGRFFLQVGYNEFFAKGQSAFAGAPYYESDIHQNVVDTDLIFINDVGESYKEVNSDKKITSAVYKGEELPNIMNEIIAEARKNELHVNKLWLDAIPANIYTDELIKKYNYTKQNFILNPIIGEYDAPEKQKQDLLTLPISRAGNTIIYGMSGSGKENLIMNIIYSLMITHFKEEVNVYVLDFGTEILNCFKNSPIVGDIISSSENDKIKNYFKFIMKEYNERKKLFQDYSGDYYTYCSKSGKTLPNIVTFINNYENFNELFGDDFSDDISKLVRDGEKCGIYFIVTAIATNSISYRLSQNFKQNICLQMNDTYDYKSILGSQKNIIPSKHKGRGLVNVDGEIYEFQTSLPTNTNNLSNYLQEISTNLLNKVKGKASSIITIPEVIDYNFILKYINEETDLKNLPIGIETETVETAKFNFLNDKFNILTSNDIEIITPYIKSIIKLIITKKEKLKPIIFDGYNAIDEDMGNMTHVNKDFFAYLKGFDKFLDGVSEKTKQTLVIFMGIEEILNSNPKMNEAFELIFSKIAKTNKVNVLFADTESTLNKYSKETWFKVDLNNGIFLGNGVDSQFLINITKITRDMRDEIPNNCGYIIKKGKAIKYKILEFYNESSD